MDPAKTSVEDLLQAPVLYISGSQAPNLLPQAQKLRDYVDRGGFIFTEACCKDSSRFDAAIHQLMTAVFPEPEYKLQPIPPGHPIWRMQDMVRPDSPYAGHLYGVEYGCRTCVVYCDQDLSCFWELARPGQWNHYPADVIQHITDALAIGVNVLTYATNREPKGKEQNFDVPLAGDPINDKTARGVIEIAKLRHGGGCNDAPGALLNLLRTASQGELKLQVRAAPDMINISDPSLFRYHLAFMHGRYDFHLTEAERKQLREYLERGGTLLGDSICASKAFAAAFRREVAAALPGHPIERIPPTDPSSQMHSVVTTCARSPCAIRRLPVVAINPWLPAFARCRPKSKAFKSANAGQLYSRLTTSVARWKATKRSAAAVIFNKMPRESA
jgi:hypothetical protein